MKILDNPKLLIIFLTPSSEASALKDEYVNLEKVINKNHSNAWLYWSSTDESNSVLGLIRNILIQESVSDINPINDYMKHTLKAFVRHVKSVTSISDRKKMRTGEDIGDIVQEKIIHTKDGNNYKIIQRDSTQIQVYNLLDNEKEIARHIMSKYIDENNININHRKQNTRSIGKKLLEYLNSASN